MRMLLWSDLQCHFSNIAECQIATKELLRTAAKFQPDVIINAGDVKDEYSPISQSVIKECVRATREIVAAGYRYIILKGNHDRESQSPDATDWLSVLKAAGAEVVTKPRTLIIANTRVAFLPFIADKVRLVKAASKLAETESYALIFHAEVFGTTPGKNGITLEDLRVENYLACFGGHIHNHQRIGDNTYVWYIGSPFTHDWSEANYPKGHLKVDIEHQDGNTGYEGAVAVEQVRTKIPLWYDADFLEEHNITPEPGAYIRSKLTVSTKKISDQLLKEERRIKTKYGADVHVHTVPVLENVSPDQLVLKGASDKDKAAQYVVATMPESSRFEARRAVTYMASKLDKVKESTMTKSVRFELASATNVLVFDKLKVSLKNLGLVLIKGVNHDSSKKRSNGSGKTSVLSCVAPIPLFGETLKKQKTDAWAAERKDDTARSYLRMRDHGGRKIEVIRTRRPHSLRLLIDGADKSSGLRGTSHKVGDTQGRIERVTGYDLQTLANAVYIDQSIANGFVFGTQSKRMDLVSRFQNLDRFDEALKMVDEDIRQNKENVAGIGFAIEASEVQIEELERQLVVKQAVPVETEWKEKLYGIRAELSQKVDAHAAAAVSKQLYDEMQQDVDDLVADEKALETKIRAANAEYAVAWSEAIRGKKLVELGRCSTCGQEAAKVGKEIVAAAQERQKTLAQARDGLVQSSAKLNQRIVKKQAKIDYYERMMEELEYDIATLRDREKVLDQAVAQEVERNATAANERTNLEQQLHMAKRLLRAQRSALKNRAIDREMLEYVKKAFHRSGMPIYLSTALCPLLNSAAEDYSTMFTDGKLKVQFKVEDGEFQVDVINPYGSETVEGQSVGEAAMAGIITAFALREAAPKTNLLVLDEPGHGLDQEGARQFAHGLLKLKDRFESILLVTHSPAIESVLAGEHLWCVEKRDGRSSLSIVR
jgi:DNA repair exonuclease SbcCD ATPase subunit/DNA repair exonuclease SbcCD nuclease subunit